MPGVPGHTHFLDQISVKTYVGTPTFYCEMCPRKIFWKFWCFQVKEGLRDFETKHSLSWILSDLSKVLSKLPRYANLAEFVYNKQIKNRFKFYVSRKFTPFFLQVWILLFYLRIKTKTDWQTLWISATSLIITFSLYPYCPRDHNWDTSSNIDCLSAPSFTSNAQIAQSVRRMVRNRSMAGSRLVFGRPLLEYARFFIKYLSNRRR